MRRVNQDEELLSEERIREEKIRSRLADRERLEAGAVTPEELPRRNSVFTREEIARFRFDFPAWRKHVATIQCRAACSTARVLDRAGSNGGSRAAALRPAPATDTLTAGAQGAEICRRAKRRAASAITTVIVSVVPVEDSTTGAFGAVDQDASPSETCTV